MSGRGQDKTPDFADLDELLQAIWVALYGPDQAQDGLTPNHFS